MGPPVKPECDGGVGTSPGHDGGANTSTVALPGYGASPLPLRERGRG